MHDAGLRQAQSNDARFGAPLQRRPLTLPSPPRGRGSEARVRWSARERSPDELAENIGETSTSSVEPLRKILRYCPHFPIKKGRLGQMGRDRTCNLGFACGGLHWIACRSDGAWDSFQPGSYKHAAPKGAWAHLGMFGSI